MKIMKKYLLIIAGALVAVAAMAQDENQLTIDAQLRTRGEYNNGAITPRSEGQSPAIFINERARVGVGFQRDNLELKVAVQHTGIWGQDDINASDGSVAMNEAWAKLKFGEGWFAQVGRQQLSYDDERILGGLDWHVSGNWHDAVRVGYEAAQDKLHLIVGWNQPFANNRGNYYDGPMPYKTMQTVWYHHQFNNDPIGLSLLLMNLGRDGGWQGHSKTRYMQTMGLDLTYKPSPVDIHGAFYYQTGKQADNDKVSAWMASAKVDYRIDQVWGVNVGYDYRSGIDFKSDKVKAFDQLFGTHHKFYGFMDYFLRNVPTGLQDIQAGLTAQVSPKVNLLLNYHYFLTACDMGDLDKGLGSEIDLQLTAKLKKDVTLMAGYSTMLGTKSMDAVKGGNHKSWQDWAWVTLNINPRIFTSKW